MVDPCLSPREIPHFLTIRGWRCRKQLGMALPPLIVSCLQQVYCGSKQRFRKHMLDQICRTFNCYQKGWWSQMDCTSDPNTSSLDRQGCLHTKVLTELDVQMAKTISRRMESYLERTEYEKQGVVLKMSNNLGMAREWHNRVSALCEHR